MDRNTETEELEQLLRKTNGNIEEAIELKMEELGNEYGFFCDALLERKLTDNERKSFEEVKNNLSVWSKLSKINGEKKTN